MPKSRRLKKVLTKTGESVSEQYCRKGMHIKRADEFYAAVDTMVDASGLFSVCKSCCNDMFDGFYKAEGSIEVATLKMCRSLNLKYSEEAIQAALSQIETMKARGNENTPFFGLYKFKLTTASSDVPIADRKHMDLTYQEITNITVSGKKLEDDAFEGAGNLKEFWGTDNEEDIKFLQNEYLDFKRTHKLDSHVEIVLLKQVCYKILDIDKARKNNGKNVDAHIKGLQALMKGLAISPDMMNAANSGTSLDTFGQWIEDIEKSEPAEWLEENAHNLYKDVDDTDGYFKKYFLRPLKNFITQSKDFNIEDDEVKDDDLDSWESLNESLSLSEEDVEDDNLHETISSE